VDSNEALVNYIADNPSSIGIIGTSWIRENSDTLKNYFTNRVRVIAVAPRDSSNTYYLPEKRFIYSLRYPFLRELFIVSQEKYAGLGTGFATYMASDEGQRIVQRSGLMPVDNAVRIIELKDKF
jgi:phosphate transport system substrate-binding protein